MANEIFKSTWWGNLTNSVGWGSIYKEHTTQSDETKEKNKKD